MDVDKISLVENAYIHSLDIAQLCELRHRLLFNKDYPEAMETESTLQQSYVHYLVVIERLRHRAGVLIMSEYMIAVRRAPEGSKIEVLVQVAPVLVRDQVREELLV